MSRCAGWGAAALLLAAQVISLPVTNPAAEDDNEVMKCIVEVISDTVSKPNPLPISQECLDILQGDKRIRSILRHQNLLKELQDIAIQGASKRAEQQKKNSGFEDELSEVLESQSDKNTGRDLSEGIPHEQPTTSFAELERSQGDRGKDVLKEDKRNSLEERETGSRGVDPGKENTVGFESNEVSETEDLNWDDDDVDNHIRDNVGDNGIHEQGLQDGEEPVGREEADEFAEKKHIATNSQEESNEDVEDSVQDHAEEEEEEEEEEEDGGEEEEEEERGTSEEEHAANSEEEDDQREDENESTKNFEKDDKLLEEEKSHSLKEGRHQSLDEITQAEEPSHTRVTESEEMEEETSKEREDAKRWNKMDELAKQLTTTKRSEENQSDEDPDQSMKLAFPSQKYDFHNPEDELRRPQAHHSKEDTREGGFPPVAMPEEKKDEEGSANRRTEEQELGGLAAIEAELEKVAQKLHALRRG